MSVPDGDKEERWRIVGAGNATIISKKPATISKWQELQAEHLLFNTGELNAENPEALQHTVCTCEKEESPKSSKPKKRRIIVSDDSDPDSD